ncbi:hypothetical protein [Schaalia radingae]|uniref:Uncharacterized protein n=1 Tax=Schaalia radingae TaxID=131110 RepID=A0ABY0V4Y0_9ACTO|nr:hypothetical protein [Schaalia radingae]SDT85828.1 hypothetical protein SAMN04489714_0170 [Schaalia radingae]
MPEHYEACDYGDYILTVDHDEYGTETEIYPRTDAPLSDTGGLDSIHPTTMQAAHAAIIFAKAAVLAEGYRFDWRASSEYILGMLLRILHDHPEIEAERNI